MKILFVSMRSIHAVRWIENLNAFGHELYWFDISNKGEIQTNTELIQYTNWKKRKIPYVKGEHYLYKKFHGIYEKIQPYLETTIEEYFEYLVNEIQPDLVHSFEMQSCSYPILETMQKFPKIKWLYSCWGSDLFYFQNQPQHVSKIKAVLSRINYLHTDCNRDFILAKNLGFKGKHTGVIPGGGGFHLEEFLPFIHSVSERKIILVKGYQHHLGRGLQIVKALQTINLDKFNFHVIVFGAHEVVNSYIKDNNLDFEVYSGKGLDHEEVLKIMGRSIIYIGNSMSDGMPNTLLEAMIMGAFPIQSNPGGATAEIIQHNVNGLLIENPEDCNEIKCHIENALNNIDMVVLGNKINAQIAIDKLSYQVNNAKIISIYNEINKN